MRHAHAEKIDGMDTHHNWLRPLSAKGIEQAKAVRPFYKDSAEKITTVFHSPAPRALCTAAIAIGENAHPLFVPVHSLWVQRDETHYGGEILWKAFDEYQYNIEEYHTDPKGIGVLEALQRFGNRTAREIREMNVRFTDGAIWIVAGHAVFSNFTAYHLAGALTNTHKHHNI